VARFQAATGGIPVAALIGALVGTLAAEASLNRFCAMFGLAACLAAVSGPPQLGSAATSPVADPAFDNSLGRATREPAIDNAANRVREPAPEPVRPSSSVDRPPTGNPLWGVPLRSLSATRERPIFSPSRRPPPPPVVAALNVGPAPPPPRPAEPDHPLLTLVGTVIGDGGGIGVFLDQATKNMVRLKTGQDYDGWTLRAVRGREAIFDKGRQTASLALPPPGSGPSPPPGVPVAAAAPAAGTWTDGDGQLVAPPRGKAVQAGDRPRPARR